MPVTLSDLVKDPPLLLAVCEHLVPFMNGSAMRRLTFLLDELALVLTATNSTKLTGAGWKTLCVTANLTETGGKTNCPGSATRAWN